MLPQADGGQPGCTGLLLPSIVLNSIDVGWRIKPSGTSHCCSVYKRQSGLPPAVRWGDGPSHKESRRAAQRLTGALAGSRGRGVSWIEAEVFRDNSAVERRSAPAERGTYSSANTKALRFIGEDTSFGKSVGTSTGGSCANGRGNCRQKVGAELFRKSSRTLHRLSWSVDDGTVAFVCPPARSACSLIPLLRVLRSSGGTLWLNGFPREAKAKRSIWAFNTIPIINM